MANHRGASNNLPIKEKEQQPIHSQSRRNFTPPERKNLPSPPLTDEVQRTCRIPKPDLPQVLAPFKRQLEAGDDQGCTYARVALDPLDFARARKQIEFTFRRFDYDPQRGYITLRMPSATHDTFAFSLSKCITDRLENLRDPNDPGHGFASNIHCKASSRISLYRDYDEDTGAALGEPLIRQPDGQFSHLKARYPGVVLEVSYSQDGKELAKLAKQYIYYSRGNIKAVIGIDIDYGTTQSTLSLWKAIFTPDSEDVGAENIEIEPVIQNEPFRLANGERVNPGNTLNLDLHDFAPEEIYGNTPNALISIPFATICDFLDTAGRMDEKRQGNGAMGIESTRRVKKRKVSSSSIEELASDDEQKFKQQEKAAELRVDDDDADFQPSGSDDNTRSVRHMSDLRATKRRG